MAILPAALLEALQGIKGFHRETFEKVHADTGNQITSIRYNPLRSEAGPGLPLREWWDGRIPWSSSGYYLKERPVFTLDPGLHAGCYYVQEASSMFLEQALCQSVDLSMPLKLLDLCAAPGGKSTLLQSLINHQSLLVSNEVIKSRVNILEENLVKWGAANVVITQNDPAHFGRLNHYFDVMVVDTPCSGSGLFRRDPAAIEEWSKNAVALCSQRQQRIIADAWPALRPGGVLIYSTCSYSREEDEDLLDWIAENYSVQSIPLSINPAWGIVESLSPKMQFHGYRFYPDKLKGEGFFISVLRKEDGAPADASRRRPAPKTNSLAASEKIALSSWLKDPDAFALIKQGDDILALPQLLNAELAQLQSALYIRRAGIVVGKLAGKDLIPDHAFALSTLPAQDIPYVDMNRAEALQYLRREDTGMTLSQKGWMLARYEGHALGWIKSLTNRLNNYYPKQWRILMQGA